MESTSKKLKVTKEQVEIVTAQGKKGAAALAAQSQQKRLQSNAERRAAKQIGEAEGSFTQQNLSTAVISGLGGEMVGAEHCFRYGAMCYFAGCLFGGQLEVG